MFTVIPLRKNNCQLRVCIYHQLNIVELNQYGKELGRPTVNPTKPFFPMGPASPRSPYEHVANSTLCNER